jgi:transcriptional regulator with XRE-family HTH domain
MLTRMEEVGRLIAAAKGSNGCTVRALADRADVATSTVTRIQAGTVDPTIDTLARILDAAGFELHLDAVRRSDEPPTRLGRLAGAWSVVRGRVRPDWTRWRAFLDQLALEPELTPEAIYVPTPPSGHPVIDALLAGVAEKLADDAGLRRPSWTATIPALAEPFVPPARGRHHVPPQLAARGLMIDAASLWRDPATVGA